jgi:outer membrane protein assembly factor BamB
MRRLGRAVYAVWVAVSVGSLLGADWPQFRGPGGLGSSNEKGVPIEWSAEKNVVWKVKLPGAGSSCPVIQGKRLFVTCYAGYGIETKNPGNMDDLRRHLLCLDRAIGKPLWEKEFRPVLPEHKYIGEGASHGYATSTPIIEGDRLYVFFWKSSTKPGPLPRRKRTHPRVLGEPRVPAASLGHLLDLLAFFAFIDSRKRKLSPFISRM